MSKIFINLHETNVVINGWAANIANEFSPVGAKSAIAIGESSTIYPTKQQAWNTISERASQLDYTENEVFFNHTLVDSYNDVVTRVAAL